MLTTCFWGCDKDPVAAPAGPALVEIDSFELSTVAEPSGLALDQDGSRLWTVSDQTGEIFLLTAGGSLVATIDIQGTDLEGIAVDPWDGTLFVVEEGAGRVLHLDREGNLLESFIPAGLPAMGDSGLEGITVDPRTGHIFLLKEKNPGLLVEMDRTGVVLATTELTFAIDYSGLDFDSRVNQLLVISDQSGTLSWCSTDGQLQQSYVTNLDKGEGIAFDPVRNVFYAVSDSRGTLTSYQIAAE